MQKVRIDASQLRDLHASHPQGGWSQTSHDRQAEKMSPEVFPAQQSSGCWASRVAQRVVAFKLHDAVSFSALYLPHPRLHGRWTQNLHVAGNMSPAASHAQSCSCQKASWTSQVHDMFMCVNNELTGNGLLVTLVLPLHCLQSLLLHQMLEAGIRKLLTQM